MALAGLRALVRIACRPQDTPITSRSDLAFVPFAAGADTFGAVLAINFNPMGPLRSFGCCGPCFIQVENHNMTQQKTAARGMGSSVISFPDRGPWGDSKWRGNASGHVYRTLFEQLSPKVFVDPMVGSGTSVEVAEEMGIESYGYDLREGYNAVTMDLLTKVGKHADLIVSHPA